MAIGFNSLNINARAKNYTIRHAEIRDIDPIVKITRTKNNRNAMPWVMKVVLQNAIENPEKNLLLVAQNKLRKVVGFVRLYFRNDKNATLHEIAIAEEMQLGGIGTALLQKSEKIAKDKSMEAINLKMPVDLVKGHEFYIKNGYKTAGTAEGKIRLLSIFRKEL